MFKKLLSITAVVLSFSLASPAYSCADPGDPPIVCPPPEMDAMNVSLYFSSMFESMTTSIISSMTKTGFTYVGATNSYQCEHNNGPIFTQNAQFCIQGRILSFYNAVTNLNAFVCQVNSNGPSVGVDVICTPDRIAGDTRDPAPRTGTGVNIAVSSPGIVAGGRGVNLVGTAVTAGFSVRTSARAN